MAAPQNNYNMPHNSSNDIPYAIYEALSKQDQRHKDEVENLRTFVVTRIETIQRDYATKTDVQDVKMQLDRLKEDVGAIKTDLGAVRGDVSNVRGDISGTQNQITKVETSILSKIDNMAEEIKDVNKKQTEKQVSDLKRIIYVQSIPLGILASLIVGAIFEFVKH